MKMNKNLELETCETLKAWGCKVKSDKCYKAKYLEEGFEICTSEWMKKKKSYWINGVYHSPPLYTYDLRDIICDGELAKKFFGEDNFDKGGIVHPSFFHSQTILHLLQLNKKAEAEALLLSETIFNPKNK